MEACSSSGRVPPHQAALGNCSPSRAGDFTEMRRRVVPPGVSGALCRAAMLWQLSEAIRRPNNVDGSLFDTSSNPAEEERAGELPWIKPCTPGRCGDGERMSSWRRCMSGVTGQTQLSPCKPLDSGDFVDRRLRRTSFSGGAGDGLASQGVPGKLVGPADFLERRLRQGCKEGRGGDGLGGLASRGVPVKSLLPGDIGAGLQEALSAPVDFRDWRRRPCCGP